MVLESLLKPTNNNPWFIFLMGIVYSSAGVLLSLSMFPDQASLVLVFFTVIACIHYVNKAVIIEERKAVYYTEKFSLFRGHAHLIFDLLILFFGFFVSFTLWKLLLPLSLSNKVFLTQLATINGLNAAIQGKALSGKFFTLILINNMKVLLISILFSFLYGVGAIFILVWNASVGGAFIGSFIRQVMVTQPPAYAFLVGMVRYVPHGLMEMAGYFAGAVAGSILSIAVMRRDLNGHSAKKIYTDFVCTVLIAMVILFVAAFVEVYITPFLVKIVA